MERSKDFRFKAPPLWRRLLKPAKNMLDDLYAKGLLDKTKYFDERLEVEFYELWHHEGRRARFGSAMMAPDYAW